MILEYSIYIVDCVSTLGTNPAMFVTFEALNFPFIDLNLLQFMREMKISKVLFLCMSANVMEIEKR